MTLRRVVLATAIALSFASGASTEEVTVVLQDGRDFYRGTRDVAVSVDPQISGRNHGGADTTWIWQFDGVSLYRFDFDYSFIPASARVIEAHLGLFCTSVGFSDEEVARSWPVAAYEFLHTWREGTGSPATERHDGATLETFDGAAAWPAGGIMQHIGRRLGEVSIDGAGRTYAWPLDPGVVQAWIAGDSEDNGILIWGPAPGKAASFASREADGTQRPTLRLRLEMSQTERERIRSMQRIQAIEAEVLHTHRSYGGLGVARPHVVSLLQRFDPELRLVRCDPCDRQPVHARSQGERFRYVEVWGDRDDLVHVVVGIPPPSDGVAEELTDAGVKDLVETLLPEWEDAFEWVVANVPRAQRQEFRPLQTQRDGRVLEVQAFAETVFVAVMTREWQRRLDGD